MATFELDNKTIRVAIIGIIVIVVLVVARWLFNSRFAGKKAPKPVAETPPVTP